MDTSWVKKLIKEDEASSCCLTQDAAVHILLGQAADSLQLLRTLWSVLPSPQVPDTSATGYWILQPQSSRTSTPLRAVTTAHRRVPNHRAALPVRMPEMRGLTTEEFADYSYAIQTLTQYEGDRLVLFLRHGPSIYWADTKGTPEMNASRFPGASVLAATKPPPFLGDFVSAAIVPSRLASLYAQHVGSETSGRPLTFVLHYATRNASLQQYHRGFFEAPCERHKKSNWYVGPLVLGQSAGNDLPVEDDEAEEEA